MRWSTAFLLVMMLGFFCSWGQPQAAARQQAPPPPAPDPHENPQVNGGDPNPPPVRPDPNAVPNPVPVRAPNLDAHPPDGTARRPATDSEMIRKIRAALLKDKTTARYAGSVRVISHAGSVRLEGKVPADVRQTVERKATEVAGMGNVTNNLNIQSLVVKKRSGDTPPR